MLRYPDIDPVALHLGPLQIHWYGIMYVVGFAVAWWLARRQAARPGSTWTNEDVDDLIFWAMVDGGCCPGSELVRDVPLHGTAGGEVDVVDAALSILGMGGIALASWCGLTDHPSRDQRADRPRVRGRRSRPGLDTPLRWSGERCSPRDQLAHQYKAGSGKWPP